MKVGILGAGHIAQKMARTLKAMVVNNISHPTKISIYDWSHTVIQEFNAPEEITDSLFKEWGIRE